MRPSQTECGGCGVGIQVEGARSGYQVEISGGRFNRLSHLTGVAVDPNTWELLRVIALDSAMVGRDADV